MVGTCLTRGKVIASSHVKAKARGKATSHWRVSRGVKSLMPLANLMGGVVGMFLQYGRNHFGLQIDTDLGSIGRILLPNSMPRTPASEEGSSAGRAILVDVVILEQNALLGQLLQRWVLHFVIVAVQTEPVPTEIVDHDHNDVWRLYL